MGPDLRRTGGRPGVPRRRSHRRRTSPRAIAACVLRAGRATSANPFSTRSSASATAVRSRPGQVVAYQARGAVLNLIASFHRPEDSIDLPAVARTGDVARAGTIAGVPTDLHFERRDVSRRVDPEPYELGWIRVPEPLGDDPMVHACAFAYCSDEYPLGTALSAHPVGTRLGPGVHGQLGPCHLVPPSAAGRRLAAVRARAAAVSPTGGGWRFARVFDCRRRSRGFGGAGGAGPRSPMSPAVGRLACHSHLK